MWFDLKRYFHFRRLDGHLGPKLTNMSADLLDVFGRNSGDKISSDTPPSILSPSICVNPVMETSKVSEDDFDLVYYNDANKGMCMIFNYKIVF